MRTEQGAVAGRKPIAVARATVKRVDGSTQTYYSYQWPWNPIRAFKLWRHLRFMRAEDRDG